MVYDFNNEDRQSSGFDLIPKGTVAPFAVFVRAGGEGEDGMLTQSRSSDAQYLDIEFTIESGPYAKRKIWQNITLSGGKLDERGESIGGRMGRAQLRALLESARRINPEDQSEQAKNGRRINSFAELNGLTVWGKIGIEKDKTGLYDDKNKIATFITPDMKDYGKATEKPQASGHSSWQQPASQPAKQPAYQPPQPSENVSPRPTWA